MTRQTGKEEQRVRIAIMNDRFTAEIETTGAELRRLYDARTQDEVLWSGDPAIWSGVAPVLFPVIGRLRGGVYRYQGREYQMPKHGFARACEFVVARQEADALTLELSDSPQTREVYPFAFRLRLTFTLSATGLCVGYEVLNTGAQTLWFSLGSHPGIRLPQEGGPYRLVFDRPQTLEVFQLNDGLLQTEGRPYLANETTIELTPSLFANDALIFKNVTAQSVTVADFAQRRRIRVTTGGAPDLGIWAKEGAAYVCIEPWYGYDDPADADGDLTHKPGIRNLPSGDAFTTAYTIEPLAAE